MPIIARACLAYVDGALPQYSDPMARLLSSKHFCLPHSMLLLYSDNSRIVVELNGMAMSRARGDFALEVITRPWRS